MVYLVHTNLFKSRLRTRGIRSLAGFFIAVIATGTLACASQTGTTSTDPVIKTVENETVAVRAGSQPVWSNDGSDADDLLVTLRSSRAQLGEGEDAFLKASANNRSGKPLSVNMVMQLGNGLIITSTNSCSGDPCTGHFELQDGIQGLMSMQVRSGGPVADSYAVVLHYDYTDPEGNKVRGKVEGLLGSTNTTQSVSASPKKSSSNDNHRTGQAVNPGNNRSSVGSDTSTSDSAPPSTLPSKDGSGSANRELIVTSGWFIDPEISTGPLVIQQSPSLLSVPAFREAVSLGIQELQVDPGFFALPNWDSLYGANQDYDLARAKEMIAEIQVSLDS